ncbi:hypothetical protein [Ralstonia syzygii]|uniref:hypothetical protein n=1 Tax=Ralstonia syzygii TaxID=28097 RepID=UPI001E55E4FE|nr:hypothetical protein [Ralstonia syzygii]
MTSRAVVDRDRVAIADCILAGHPARLVNQPVLRNQRAKLVADEALRCVPAGLGGWHVFLSERCNALDAVFKFVGVHAGVGGAEVIDHRAPKR